MDRGLGTYIGRGVLAVALAGAGACATDVGSVAPTGPLASEEVPALASRSGSDGATVYVVHGINGRDLGAVESLPVDVVVNGSCVLRGFTFRQIAGPLPLPAGSYNIAVRLANATAPCTGPVAISASGVPLAAGQNVSIVAHLSPAGAPTASVFANETSTRDGTARLTARHTAAFGAVDVLVDRRVAFRAVTNGQQGSAQLRPGRHVVSINPAGSSATAWQAALRLRPSRTYIAYAVGTPANGTFGVILQTISRDKANERENEREDVDDDEDGR